MTVCEKCKRKSCLKVGKPCKKVEKVLKKEKIYGLEYIRPLVSANKRKDGCGRSREIPFSSINWDISLESDHDR
jgi:hypothetical protein